MAEFLLIHGAWYGAWCWEKTIRALNARGHRASAIDMPGAGADPTPVESVSLDDYVKRIGEELGKIDGKVVLVGHSMGGILISAAAEAYPDRIERLIYVCAFLPRNGESLMALERNNPVPSVALALIMSESGRSATIQNDRIIPLFFHDCTPEDQQWAKSMVTPQPAAPLFAEVSLTEQRFGSIPRSYIACTDDRAINIAHQRDMIAASAGVEKILETHTSHSPFLSRPDRLVDLLVKAI